MIAIIDTSTGIILETINNTLGEDWFLVTWSIELEPQWLVDIGQEEQLLQVKIRCWFLENG